MRQFALLLLFTLLVGVSAMAQKDAGQIKTISSTKPVFPAQASSHIYGDKIQVGVEVDKQGKVKRAVAGRPLIPCSNRNDKTIEEIRTAATEATKATVFAPLVENGEAIDFNVMLSYPLTEQKILVADEKKPASPPAKVLPKPYFTAEAKANRIGGKVEVRILIDETGKVLSFLPISGHSALIGGTIDSACNARFEPTINAGVPAKIIGKITYTFVP